MEFAPPSGPPPPKLPSGWLARWNEQYSEWFYVNMYTKQSQWEKPTEPVYPPSGTEDSPPGPPPGYNPANAQPVSDAKTGASRLSSNNPYGQAASPSAATGAATFPTAAAPAPQQDISEDERIAREMQAEEDARGAANANRGAADSYYQQQQPPPQQPGVSSFNQDLPPRPEGKSKGFLGKLFGKSSSSSHGRPQYGGYPQGYGGPPPGPYGGAYPPQQAYPGYGYPPGPYGGHGGHGGYGGYGGPPPRRSGGGIGTGGAAALGVGGGLLGGMLLADAMDDNDYQEGYEDGQDDGGGDDGGGD